MSLTQAIHPARTNVKRYTSQNFLPALVAVGLPPRIRRLHISFHHTDSLSPIGETECRETCYSLKERLFHKHSALEWVQFSVAGHHSSWARLDERSLVSAADC